MDFFKRYQDGIGWAFSLIILSIFVIWAETNTETLSRMVVEDGPIENLSAVFK